MFEFFKRRKNIEKKNSDFVITTRITKTVSQAQYEKEIQEQIDLKITTCPNCGHVDKYSQRTIPQQYENTNICVVSSTCTKCSTEWDTEYEEI